MPNNTSTEICRDISYLAADFQPKVLAVISDVNGNLKKRGLSDKLRLAVFETKRSSARQEMLFKQGRTKTHNSKHEEEPCKAADVVFQKYNQRTNNWEWFWPMSGSWEWKLVDSSAAAHNIKRISWDAPHLQAE